MGSRMSLALNILQADASEQQGTLLPREKQKAAYNNALVERYKHLPEVSRIVRHRHLPSSIYKVCVRSTTVVLNLLWRIRLASQL
jgi:DDB1- and CUL4-associated factor 13